jgi:O-antigen biosynthesis protein
MKRPYVIFCPAWDRTSGGNRIMHQLGNDLVEAGEDCVLATDFTGPDIKASVNKNPDVKESIVIYPEITQGNPLEAGHVVRYLLRETDTDYGRDLVYAFCNRFLRSDMPKDRILFLPIADMNVFKDYNKPRRGCVYYVGRSKGTRMADVTMGCKEISMSWPSSHKELVEVFNTAETFYTYVSTGLIAEAALCGCPVVMLFNEKMTYRIDEDVGWNGIAKDISFDELKRAKDTIGLFRDDYKLAQLMYKAQLKHFITVTQEVFV